LLFCDFYMQKPSLPQGTRDFSPEILAKRKYIFDTIEKVFRKFAFQQLETPAMEQMATLTGKYGEEGDKLLYKILNSGDFLSKCDAEDLASKNSGAVTAQIAEKGLRYDLTVPLARYVVMHQNEIVFPFKRYQMQAVWRADRPQKGRYREFYQCDADVLGNISHLNEAELLIIYDQVFQQLGIPVEIKINNRKLLEAAAHEAGLEASQFVPFTVIIDKLDKIGKEKVIQELDALGWDKTKAISIFNSLEPKDFGQDALDYLTSLYTWDAGKEGWKELNALWQVLKEYKFTNKLIMDGILARGLNYYTGLIVEVKALGIEMGSIGGGGRYDDLTGVFGLKNIAGVGISFGVDRIYDVMENLNLFPEMGNSKAKIVVCCAEEHLLSYGFQIANALRKHNIPTEIYPEAAKLKKQLNFANQYGIPYAAIIGSEEFEKKQVALKDMTSGLQENVSLTQLIELMA